MAQGELTLGYLESGQRRHPRSALTFEELSKEMGISFTTLQMVYVTLGLAGPKSDEHVREEDLPMLQSLPVLFGAGVDEGEVLLASFAFGPRAHDEWLSSRPTTSTTRVEETLTPGSS